jgi:hypothetical protein
MSYLVGVKLPSGEIVHRRAENISDLPYVTDDGETLRVVRLKERRSRHTARHRQNFRCWPAISSWFARRIRARAARSMRHKSVRSPTVKPTNSAITSRVPVLAASSRGLHGNVWGPTAHAWLTRV